MTVNFAQPVPTHAQASLSRGKDREQTLGEEIANGVTHGIGLVLAGIGLAVLVAHALAYDEMIRIVSASIYGATLVVLYLASTLYHCVQTPRLKRWLRIFDHTAVYLLIAGTYTPFTLLALRGSWGWTLLGMAWGLALVGILYTLFAFGRFERFSLALYLAMGWIAIIAIKPILHALSTGALILMGAGGLAYTLGVVFYLLQNRRFFHTVWHLFVIGGSACHFTAVLLFMIPAAHS